MGNFRNNIQRVDNEYKKFSSSLTKEQLEYLHNSKYEKLKEIYIVILNRAIENNIEIDYIDEKMKLKINEYNQKKRNISTLEEQIVLEQQYKKYIVIDCQFDEFIDYIISNNGKLPSRNSTNNKVKQLGIFRSNIKTYNQEREKFSTPLSKEQLEYLHNSEYQSLQELYNAIMEKAYSVNYQEYIDIDNEIRNNNRKGRAA